MSLFPGQEFFSQSSLIKRPDPVTTFSTFTRIRLILVSSRLRKLLEATYLTTGTGTQVGPK